MDSNDLRAQARTLYEENRKVIDLAEAEGRELTDEEKQSIDARHDAGDEKRADADRLDRQAKAEKASNAVKERQLEAEHEEEKAKGSDVSYRTAFWRYQMLEKGELLTDAEYRALQDTNDEAGGYLSPNEEYVAELIQAVDDAVVIRQHARTFQVANADSLGAPSLDADPADHIWTTELAIGDEDSTMDFGKRLLTPHPLAKYIKVSRKLLRKALIGPEALVRERMAYKLGTVLENAYLTGSGASQPLGVMTASDLGVGTGRDVSEGNTTTSMTFDGLKEAKYTLKGQYHMMARWMFHRDGVKQIAKLKDGEGQYLWQPSVTQGEPDRLFGIPVDMSEFMSNTFTTGLYVGILADWSNYWIVDAMNPELRRLDEVGYATDETIFVHRMESDGAPVLAEAFVRVKLG